MTLTSHAHDFWSRVYCEATSEWRIGFRPNLGVERLGEGNLWQVPGGGTT